MDNTNVVTGANNAVAYGSGNTVKESDANFRDRDYEKWARWCYKENWRLEK